MKRLAPFVFPLLLAGCGTLPQPFLGRPGQEGAILAVPPPPMLFVPPPTNAMLGNRAATLYATDLAQALVKQDVPSLARPPGKYDWRLESQASISGNQVTPHFAIIGPTGRVYGHVSGSAVPAGTWAAGDPVTLQSSAASIAPELAKQLTAINASVQQSNPQSLENRPPRILLSGVTGAPGDGDHALTLNLERNLPQLGLIVVHNKKDADFLITGTIRVTPNKKATGAQPSDLVELDWTVDGQGGRFIGKVSQLHDLLPSQMTPYWGDVAAAAAQQAALGLKQVIVNAIPKRVGPKHPAKASEHAKSAQPPAQ